MASRAEAKAQARQARLEKEQKAAATAAQRRRMMILGGVLVAAVVVIVAAIAISSSGNSTSPPANPETATARASAARVGTLLAGIQQSGNTLGNPKAPVTVTEYGDLECSVCDSFALPTNINTSAGTPGSGVADQVINQLVKTGKAKFAYRALDTATSGGATPNMFNTQQAAVYAAGQQGKAWNYLELFYNEQGAEGTSYVTQGYLEGLAKQIPGLDYNKWLADMHSSRNTNQVTQDVNAGTAVDNGQASTPTVVVTGPKGRIVLPAGIPSFAAIQHAVNSTT
jgi:protein-disulfide isomerase